MAASARMTRIPQTQAEALDLDWLSEALAKPLGHAAVTAVEVVEVIRTMATKIRFRATFDGDDSQPQAFCMKAFLDVDLSRGGGATSILESDFYTQIAPHIAMRVPTYLTAAIDRDAPQAVIFMRDEIAAGARFCSALEPFGTDQAAATLEQLAFLHTNKTLLPALPWVRPRIARFAEMTIVPQDTLQDMLNGPRGIGLPERTRDAGLLVKGIKALAGLDAARAQTLLHGDCHAGNIFETSEGPGFADWQLVQSGGWALDVAYHIAAVLPVDVAEREERALLRHYLDVRRKLGDVMPDDEQAWAEYCSAPLYGYYLWSITRMVDPDIINIFVNRLGSAVTRHDTHALLGL